MLIFIVLEFIEFYVDTLEECEGWIRSFSINTGVKVSNKDQKMIKPQASGKDYKKLIKKGPSNSKYIKKSKTSQILTTS